MRGWLAAVLMAVLVACAPAPAAPTATPDTAALARAAAGVATPVTGAAGQTAVPVASSREPVAAQSTATATAALQPAPVSQPPASPTAPPPTAPTPPPTSTPLQPTATPVPTTATPVPLTATPVPPTSTPTPGPKGVVLPPIGPAFGGKLRTIALDPGHGGPETGSAPADDLVESRINLDIALVLAELLREDGFRVVLTRDSDGPVSPAYTRSGVRSEVVQDLQARVDIANGAKAELFLSIHNNGSGDPSARGTEVWYNAARPFAERNLYLAEQLLEGTLRQLRAAGHATVNRGVKDDANFRIWNGRPFNLYVLGPGPGGRPATEMPGVLGESLFLTNPADAAALRTPRMRQAIARGYRDAVLRYVEKFPSPVGS